MLLERKKAVARCVIIPPPDPDRGPRPRTLRRISENVLRRAGRSLSTRKFAAVFFCWGSAAAFVMLMSRFPRGLPVSVSFTFVLVDSRSLRGLPKSLKPTLSKTLKPILLKSPNSWLTFVGILELGSFGESVISRRKLIERGAREGGQRERERGHVAQQARPRRRGWGCWCF